MLILTGCKEDQPIDPKPVDAEFFKIQKKLTGLWVSTSTQIWQSEDVHALYESSIIDCKVDYSYHFDMVKYMEVDDSLAVINTYFCTPAHITKLDLYRVVNDTKIKISETYKGNIIKKYTYSFNSDSTELKLEAVPGDFDRSYIKPLILPVYKYVLLLKKQ